MGFHEYKSEGICVDEDSGEFGLAEPAKWNVSIGWKLSIHSWNISRIEYFIYVPQIKVPESCIKSAEFVIRCDSASTLVTYTDGSTAKPHVIAEFGGSKTINITTSSTVADDVTGKSQYGFAGGLPGVGEGIMIGNITTTNETYNMHFGAIVARHKTAARAVITNVSELGDDTKMIKKIPIRFIGTVGEFRGATYSNVNTYKLGILYAQP